MDDTLTTTGTVRQGELRLRHGLRFRQAIGRFPDGTEVVVSVSRQRETRSVQANRYLWGVCYRLMAEDTGHQPEEIHEDMKLRFLTQTITWVNKATGEVEERQVPRSSARLPVEDFCLFVDQVKLFASEFLGLTIPEANEVEPCPA